LGLAVLARVAQPTADAETTAVLAPEVRYARSGDLSIAYSVVGDGPFDVVFAPNWLLSSLEIAWDGPPARLFEQLGSFCRLILFDKRGTGLSDRVTGVADLESRMDDVRAVMDAADSERAALFGVDRRWGDVGALCGDISGACRSVGVVGGNRLLLQGRGVPVACHGGRVGGDDRALAPDVRDSAMVRRSGAQVLAQFRRR
jgi:pimeloyl-ACP methyl ester carboxylesterase